MIILMDEIFKDLKKIRNMGYTIIEKSYIINRFSKATDKAFICIG